MDFLINKLDKFIVKFDNILSHLTQEVKVKEEIKKEIKQEVKVIKKVIQEVRAKKEIKVKVNKEEKQEVKVIQEVRAKKEIKVKVNKEEKQEVKVKQEAKKEISEEKSTPEIKTKGRIECLEQLRGWPDEQAIRIMELLEKFDGLPTKQVQDAIDDLDKGPVRQKLREICRESLIVLF
jgi:hypothetical protein